MPITRWTPGNVTARVDAAFKPAAKGLEEVAKGLAPRKSGRLAAGTHMTYTGTTSGFLSASDVPYAAPVIKGSRPHEIDAKNAQAMPIGKYGFASVVHHPGTQPHPYLQRAAASFRTLYVNAARSLFHLGF